MRIIEYELDEMANGTRVRTFVNPDNIVQVRKFSTNTTELRLADGAVVRVVESLEHVLEKLRA